MDAALSLYSCRVNRKLALLTPRTRASGRERTARCSVVLALRPRVAMEEASAAAGRGVGPQRARRRVRRPRSERRARDLAAVVVQPAMRRFFASRQRLRTRAADCGRRDDERIAKAVDAWRLMEETASPDELSAAERIRSARRRANEQRNATESEAPAETTTEAVDREDERRSVSTITENQLPPPPLDGPTEVSRSVQTRSPTPGRS